MHTRPNPPFMIPPTETVVGAHVVVGDLLMEVYRDSIIFDRVTGIGWRDYYGTCQFKVSRSITWNNGESRSNVPNVIYVGGQSHQQVVKEN